MGVSYNARLVTDGMILCLDPANQISYPSTNPENLLLSSSNVSSSLWSKGNSRIGYDLITSPDGNINAHKIIEDTTANNYHFISQNIGIISGTHTLSCFIKAGERYKGYIQIFGSGGNATASFDLIAGTITGGSGTTTITPYPNGWYRLTTTLSFGSASADCYLVMSDDNNNPIYTGNGNSGLYFWGPQIETGSVATTYTPTTNTQVRRTFRDINSGLLSTPIGTYGLNTTAYSVPTLEINNNGTTSDGQIQVNTQDLNYLATTQNFTVMFAAKKNFYGLTGNNTGNSQLFQGVVNGYTSGWRITEYSQGTPGNAFTSQHSWGLGYNDINTAHGATDSASATNRMCIVAFTVSPTTMTAFCNGTTATRSNPLTYVQGASTPRISFNGAGAGSFNGLLGYFAIYNRALSQTEIEQNYNVLRVRYGI